MFRNPAMALILFCTVLCITVSAQQQKPAQPAAPAGQPASTSAVPAADAAESDLVVVKVSGEPVTEKQILSAIDMLSRVRRIPLADEQKKRNPVLFDAAIDSLATATALRSEAKRQNITVDQAKIDDQIKQFEAQLGSRENFLKEVAKRGMTEAEIRKSIEDEFSVRELLSMSVKDTPPASEEEIQKFYEANAARFSTPEQAHLAQIYLKVTDNAPEKRAEVKKRLEGIRADIEAKKLTFSDAATKFSQDESAAKGGDLAWYVRGGKLKSLEAVLFALEPGGMTDVIEDPAGYRIIQMIGKKPAATKSLEELKPMIKAMVEQNAKERASQKYMQELKSKAVIERFMTPEIFEQRHPVR